MNDSNQQHFCHCFTLFFLRSLVGPVVKLGERRNHILVRNLSFSAPMKLCMPSAKLHQYSMNRPNLYKTASPAQFRNRSKKLVSGGKKSLTKRASHMLDPTETILKRSSASGR